MVKTPQIVTMTAPGGIEIDKQRIEFPFFNVPAFLDGD
jgi:hypothetical protein